MQLTTIAQATQNQTMSHIQIAELTGSRKDSVKRAMERMHKNRVIQLTPTVEVNHLGQSVDIYHVNERDSYIVVAQLSPEFTAVIVDEWQRLKKQVPELSQDQQLVMLAHGVIRVTAERDEAIRTKAHINDKRTATLMAKASHDSKRIKKLESQLQDQGDYISLLASGLPERVDTEFKDNAQTWRLLVDLSKRMNLPTVKVKDQRYGEVNTYHTDVIEAFKAAYL